MITHVVLMNKWIGGTVEHVVNTERSQEWWKSKIDYINNHNHVNKWWKHWFVWQGGFENSPLCFLLSFLLCSCQPWLDCMWCSGSNLFLWVVESPLCVPDFIGSHHNSSGPCFSSVGWKRVLIFESFVTFIQISKSWYSKRWSNAALFHLWTLFRW